MAYEASQRIGSVDRLDGSMALDWSAERPTISAHNQAFSGTFGSAKESPLSSNYLSRISLDLGGSWIGFQASPANQQLITCRSAT